MKWPDVKQWIFNGDNRQVHLLHIKITIIIVATPQKQNGCFNPARVISVAASESILSHADQYIDSVALDSHGHMLSQLQVHYQTMCIQADQLHCLTSIM